jgi:hypothetical protein
MFLAFVAALALQSNVPSTWQIGGGRTWMNPGGPVAKSLQRNVVPLEGEMEFIALLGEMQEQPINGRTWLLARTIMPECLSNGYCFTAKQLEARQKEAESPAAVEAMRGQAKYSEGLARKGNARDMARYGFMLLNGLLVPRDEVAAMGWFYEAAQRDDGMSMYALACGFKNGVGVAQDAKLAAFWAERAAKKNFTKPC